MPPIDPSPPSATPPLAGLTVLDFSRVIAGPFLTQMLADFGADVIKVEAPGVGDDMRHFRPIGWTKDAPGFVGLNRNKRSIEIDIASPAGQDLCRRLAAKADFLVQNFRAPHERVRGGGTANPLDAAGVFRP